MELRPNLAVQARQAITITPQVIQSIKLLKYGHDELLAFLREQEERNPLIEVVQGTPDQSARPKPAAQAGGAEGGSAGHRAERALPSSGKWSSDSDLRSLEETCASSLTLREHMLRQVYLTMRNPVHRAIGAEIAESMDPDGYLRRDLDEIAEALGVDEAVVHTVLMEVQTFEPAGIAARDLAECLRLQLMERGELTCAMETLLDHLDLLAGYDFDRLARLCGVDRADLTEMAHLIRELDPRPGLKFDTDPIMPAMPDLKLDMAEDGDFRVELNSELLPKILVDREYYSEVKAGAHGEDDTRFVTDCMRNATWLARNLDQRANTVLKVATAIVAHQRDFFLKGVEHIKPLSQSDIAETVGMHPSTICRATSEKYIMTNRGMYELKFFFSNALSATDGGDEHSAESIRAKIRHLVDGEAATSVLSDDAIMAQLRKDGVDIARRTVAKYREMLNIPSSQIRKRQKRAEDVERKLCVA